ncbi:MAG: NAD(+) synthase, partial [Candidatus Helarchaeota archaeon]
IGYFTKYGDGGVDFVPIQHLYKHEVREMARFLGVPEKIVARKPSAGLWEGQTDEDELSQQLGFAVNYDILDEMLENIINDNYDKNDERYQKFVALRLKNKHKLEAPPGLERL